MTIARIIICILAAYGFLELLNELYLWILRKNDKGKPHQYILLVTKNNRDMIEYYLRSALEKLAYGFEEVLVMDLESTDGTKEIVKKFADDNRIRIVRWK
jgi:hypothetical protein